MGAKSELLQATSLFLDGTIKPIIDRVFPLPEAAQAQQHLEASAQFGKVVLTV
jgi:NADPH:quinone reductase-like Zn-dependent oxidoreductase